MHTRWRRRGIVSLAVAGLVVAVLTALAIRFPLSSDALRARVVRGLANRLDATVELERLSIRVFPRLQASGAGLIIHYRDRRDLPPLISIGEFAVDADLIGLWRRRIAHVQLDRLVINIPPGEARKAQSARDAEAAASAAAAGSGSPSGGTDTPDSGSAQPGASQSYARDLVIEELEAPDAQLVILRNDPAKVPKTWYMHRLRVRSVGLARAMPFDALLTNAVPPGQIDTVGTFGPWDREAPGSTPLDGRFTFDNANLNVFKGIAGILSARGTFGGSLERIEVNGETETPDFMVTLSGHEVPLKTTYHAIVDGTNGNTTLDPVDAKLLDTPIVARGGVYEVEGVKGREVRLDVTIDQGRLEDVLRLAMKTPGAAMRGGLHLATSLKIPPGPRDVVDKLELDGRFAIQDGSFANKGVQAKINELSQRARGQTGAATSEQVASDFAGQFRLSDGNLRLSALTFDVPGAVVSLNGQYLAASGDAGVLRQSVHGREAVADGDRPEVAAPSHGRSTLPAGRAHGRATHDLGHARRPAVRSRLPPRAQTRASKAVGAFKRKPTRPLWRSRRRAVLDRRVRCEGVTPQPRARLAIARTYLLDQPPESRRMIHPLQVHQFVIQHVVAHPRRHRHQAPVQRDVPRGRTRPPPVTLAADGDPPDGEAKQFRERLQTIGQFMSCLCHERRLLVRRQIRRNLVPLVGCAPLLRDDPLPLLLEKRGRLALRPAARDGDADAAVQTHPDPVPACAGMTDEGYGQCRQRRCLGSWR